MHYRTSARYFESPAGREVAQVKLRRTVAVVAAAMFLISSGCTNGGSKKATDSPTPPSTARTSSSILATTPRPSATTADPTTVETANRQAVEAAWEKFWTVYVRLHSIPTPQIAVDSVAVGVTKTQMLNEIKVFRAGHKTSYGYVINHPYWNQSVGGKPTATMGDCMDQSHYGSASTVTHKKLTVGIPHDNTRATFAKGADGVWRVDLIEYLLDTKC
jgi:hypothetical protein